MKPIEIHRECGGIVQLRHESWHCERCKSSPIPTTATESFNVRYVAYALAHKHTPYEQSKADEIAWPGGRMAGFQIWMDERWQEWCKLKGYRRTASGSQDTPLSNADHREFDGWLFDWAKSEELKP